jgi:S-DNA-T family DNA segregation ATPase FtsK/SpoIIIE
MRIELPSPPWLPPLPPMLGIDSLPATADAAGRAVIGLVDLPHLQRQDPLVIDLPAVGNVAVYGAGGSGKTTLLITAALSLAQSHTPEGLRIYGLDAGSGGLAVIDQLPHCGGVIRVEDEERVDRLFRELVRQIETHSSGRSPAPAPMGLRRTILLLDDLGAFAHLHEKPGAGAAQEQLQKIAAGGRAAGVHIIFTASRRGAVSSVLAAHVGQRLVLRMPTHEDLLSLGLDSKRVKGANLPPGRGFTQDSSEFQIAVPIHADGRFDFGEAAQRAKPGSRDTTRVATLPINVPRASLGAARSSAQIPIGLADVDLAPAHVDLSGAHYLVVGSYRSGRSTALETLALGLSNLAPVPRLWLLSPRRSPLRDLDVWEEAATDADACAQVIGVLTDESPAQAPGAAHMFLFIDDGGEIADPLLSAKLERIVRAGRDGGITVVAGVETSGARGIAIPWIREIRKDGHGLLLQPDLLADGDLLGTRLPRRVAVPMVPGRGFVVARGVAELVQVAS